MKRTEKSYNSGTRIVEASLRRSNKSELFRFIIHEKFIARSRPNDVVAIFTAASYIFFINHLFIIGICRRQVRDAALNAICCDTLFITGLSIMGCV